MADWPLSPALKQRQQQLDTRKQMKQILEAERAAALASKMGPPAPFSPAAYIRGDPMASSSGLTATNSAAPTTPRHFSVRYEMGYSNVPAGGDSANDSPARRMLAARQHQLEKSDLSFNARREGATPHQALSVQITNGGRNELGSAAAGTAASARSKTLTFSEQRSRSIGASMSLASKAKGFGGTLNASKHSHSTGAHLNAHAGQPWVANVNLKVPGGKQPTTNAKIDKSAADVQKNLERHLNDLIALRYRCEQRMDAMSKEYSVLVNATTEAEETVLMLRARHSEHSRLLDQWNALPALATESPSLRHQNQRMAEIAAQDPHRRAFKDGMWTLNPLHNPGNNRKGVSGRTTQAEAGASYVAASRDATRGGAVLVAPTTKANLSTTITGAERIDPAVFVGLNNAEKALRYIPVVEKEMGFLKKRVDRCRQMLADTASASDRLQHLAMLMDSAMNIDLVCMGRLPADDSINVPASPAYPTLTLSDFDAVENESASLTAYCTRAAAELRKAVQSAVAGHSQCFEALLAAMKLGVKCAEAKQEECQRQIDEIDRDTIHRVQRSLDECLQEEEHCGVRKAEVERIVNVRATALGSSVFGERGGNDPVVVALLREAQQLEQRQAEIDVRKECLLREYDLLQREREHLVATIESAAVSQRIVEEIKARV